MQRARLFLEVAVPTWCMSFLPNASRAIRGLVTEWGPRRRNASLLWSKWAAEGFASDFAHPMKLTNPDALMYHASVTPP